MMGNKQMEAYAIISLIEKFVYTHGMYMYKKVYIYFGYIVVIRATVVSPILFLFFPVRNRNL